MKKSNIFIILIVFALSIVLISFFGLVIRNDQFKVYVETMEIDTTDLIIRSGDKVKYLDYEGPGTSYEIPVVFTPDNATDKTYQLFIDFDEVPDITEGDVTEKAVKIDKVTNEIIFLKPATVRVQVLSKDGSSKKDEIIIICRIKN